MNSTPSPHDIQKSLGLKPKSKWRKKRYYLLGLIAAIVAAGYVYNFVTPEPDPALAYRTQEAAQSTIVATISATGTVQPLNQIEVSGELSGTVREVKVVENQQVTQGDTLLVLDSTRLEAQRARALAQIAAAESRQAQALATAKQSERDLLRQNRLRVGGLASDQAQETAASSDERAQAALLAALADVKAARADLAQVEVDLAKSSIIAPISGMVLKTNVKVGQTVAASLSGAGLITLAENLNKVRIEAAVDESDIGQVKLGQEATFKVDAFRNQIFTGKVSAISYYPDKTDGVVTYKTQIDVANADLLLRPGMTATPKIIVAQADDVLTVPNEALRFVLPKVEAGKSGLFKFGPPPPEQKPVIAEDGSRELNILRAGKAITVLIKTGLSDGKFTQILTGDVKLGDAVILGLAQE